MNTQTIKEQEMQRIPQRDPGVPEQVAGAFLMLRVDLSVMAQEQPEMTDDEVLMANSAVAGFSWLNDPSEDVY